MTAHRPASPAARRPAGFTLIEVLCSVMVLALGVVAAVGMLLYGLDLAKLSIGRTTGMATAMSVAVDASPLLPAGATWTPAVPGLTTGYMNGYWVERTEGAPEIVAPGVTTANVKVDIYETSKGRILASYNQRIVRRP